MTPQSAANRNSFGLFGDPEGLLETLLQFLGILLRFFKSAFSFLVSPKVIELAGILWGFYATFPVPCDRGLFSETQTNEKARRKSRKLHSLIKNPHRISEPDDVSNNQSDNIPLFYFYYYKFIFNHFLANLFFSRFFWS